MATTRSYYDELKAKYDAAALAKKQAMDEALVRASTAQFDDKGNITGYNYGGGTGPGSLDVQQMETERLTKGAAEGAGMLRSGQLARDLATSQAEYRSRVIGMREGVEADKRTVEAEQQTNIAEAKAMYDTPKPATSSATGQTPSRTTPPASQQRITPPPSFTPPGTNTPKTNTPRRTTVPQGPGRYRPVGPTTARGGGAKVR